MGGRLGELLVILAIVVMLFGTKRLTSGARDIGKAVDEFKKGMRGEDDKPAARIGEDATKSQSERRDRDDVAR